MTLRSRYRPVWSIFERLGGYRSRQLSLFAERFEAAPNVEREGYDYFVDRRHRGLETTHMRVIIVEGMVDKVLTH